MADQTVRRRVVIAAALIGAALGAALAGVIASFLLGFDGDDEERPPIIISNGSIKFAILPVFSETIGTWQQSAGAWIHPLSDENNPQVLRVHVGGTIPSQSCNQVTYRGIAEIELRFKGQALSSQPVRIDIWGPNDARVLRVQPQPFPAGTDSTGTVLTVGKTGMGEDLLESARLLNNGGQERATCQFGDAPWLLVQQKNKPE